MNDSFDMQDVCGKCIRPISPNHTRCMYCGGAPVKPEAPDEAIACPQCSVAMHKVVEADVTLDRRGGCGGTWYDRGELEALMAQEESQEPGGQELEAESSPETESRAAASTSAKKLPGAEDIVYLACPRCQGRMTRRNYMRTSAVITDVCGHHGLFLNRGEHERISAFHADGGGVSDMRAMDDAAYLKHRKKEERQVLKRLGQYSASEYFTW